MEEKIIEKVDEKLEQVLNDDISNNIDYLYKLTKIKHLTKEDKNMYNEYGNYGRYDGRGPSRGSYGNYNEGYNDYGRRGVDSKYRGYGHLDRMYNEYGNYSYGRERYGANEETDKSFHYMVKALEDFIKVLYEEADTQQQKQQLAQALQNSMR